MPTYTLNNIIYTFTIGNPSAFVSGSVVGITTANIPSTIDISSNIYNITSIGNAAFQGRTALTSVTIPNSVTSTGDSAFFQCSALTSVTIPNSVTTIGDYTFYFCTSLNSATIGSSVTTIGVSAFQHCSALSSVTIPNSVTSIGDSAFQECSALSSVTIPNSVTTIGSAAFKDCSALTSATIGSSVTTIGYYAFQGCTTLTSVTIPNSVTSIGISVFQGCSALTSVTIPNSVTSIGDSAFAGCSLLNSVSIGSSVTSIGSSAFYNCIALTSVIIPSSVISIANTVFLGCSNLNLVYFLRTPVLPSIGASAFTNISPLSVGKYYSTVIDTTPINPPVFNSISTIIPPTLTSITPFTGNPTRLSIISYNDLVTNGNESVSNTPYVFLVNSVSTGSLSIGATQGSATPWNASTNKTINASNNAYWSPSGSMSGLLNAFSVVIQDSVSIVTSPNVDVQVSVPYPCFLEGTKILCFVNNQEVYCEIESLRKGDLVKTIYNGYMPINIIGTTSLYNPGNDYRVVNRLYKCSREKYPTLFEDLYITGCHSILVPSMTDDQWENTKAVNGTIFVTDNHFRLIACADENAEPFNNEGFVNIYHIALEHPDILMNYGIYANGLLVESCSERNLRYLSNMRILGEEDCAVSENVIKVPFNMSRQLVDTY